MHMVSTTLPGEASDGTAPQPVPSPHLRRGAATGLRAAAAVSLGRRPA